MTAVVEVRTVQRDRASAALLGVLRRILPLLLLLVLWQLFATVFAELKVIPTPTAIAEAVWAGRDSFLQNALVTTRSAAIGYLIGNALAIVLGVVCVQAAWAERVVLKVAVASFCIPQVAIAPILVVVLSGTGPQQALAALAVFFTTLISVLLGLRSANPASLTVVRSLGGGRRDELVRVRLFALLPYLFSGLKIAAPAALLGAIVGEYMGAPRGLGVLLVQFQSSFQVAETWAVAAVMALAAGLAYAVCSVIGRLAVPWAAKDVTLSAGAAAVQPAAKGAGAVKAILGGLLSLALVVAGWYAAIQAFGLNPYFAKTPTDIIGFLFVDDEAAAHRAQLWDGMQITLRDAALGYAVGTAVSVGVAVLVVSSRWFENAVMPVALVLRSVPLVAMAPLLALVFGRGLIGVSVVVSIAIFFPTLVSVVLGLRSAPQLAIDVVRSLGGSDGLAMRKVRLLYSLPAFFAAAKMAVPGALAGATLAEWLATGEGIGAMLIHDYAASRFSALWSGAVLVVLASVLMYGAISVLERAVLRRFGA